MPSVRPMRVTFRKTHRRGYAVDIAREHGEDLTMNPAPGYDELLPHDLVHLLVEIRWVSATASTATWPPAGTPAPSAFDDERPTEETTRERRRKARRAQRSHGGADMGRSEHLAGVVHARWNARHRGVGLPDWYPTPSRRRGRPSPRSRRPWTRRRPSPPGGGRSRSATACRWTGTSPSAPGVPASSARAASSHRGVAGWRRVRAWWDVASAGAVQRPR